MTFNLTDKALVYRSPLKLLEALEGDSKRSWDQGDIHAKRDKPYDDSGAKDKEYYKIGFEAGKSSRQVSNGKKKSLWKRFNRFFSFGADRTPETSILKPKKTPIGSTTSVTVPLRPKKSYSTASKPASGGIPAFVERGPGRVLPKPLTIDRSPVKGQPKHMRPPGWGLPKTILKNRMDNALGSGYTKWFSLDYESPKAEIDDKKDSSRVKEQKRKLAAARDEMMARDPNKYQIGKFIGAGAAGAVFEGPDDPDGMPTVFKFDNGPYEARMADMVMNAGFSGKNGLSILPRYISTAQTSQNMTAAKLPLFAIHREDLDDVHDTLDKDSIEFLGDFGNAIGDLSRSANQMRHRFATREEVLDNFDDEARDYHQRAMMAGGQLAKQWPKMVEEMRTLLEHGIIPCDLHESNWGVRKSNGEIAMRDVGCAVVISK
jgi:hypothetical protein